MTLIVSGALKYIANSLSREKEVAQTFDTLPPS
jgi:hypothetical protein